MAVGLPNRIKELRDARGWSLSDLNARSGITVSKLQRLETGTTTTIDIGDWRKIAAAFGVRMSALLNDEDVETRIDEFGAELLDVVKDIPPQARANVVAAARHVVTLAQALAARENAAALGGRQDQLNALAEMWNSFDDTGREEAIGIWNLSRIGKRA